MAENDWTCYRRNYFQLSSAFLATDAAGQEVEFPCLLEHENQLVAVNGFALCIAARVANGEKRIDLVQHTPKRDKGPQIVPQPKACKPGGNPHQYNGLGTNQAVVTFERVQFKTATANNGKRRAAQQYYVLIVELYAVCQDGQQIKMATTESAPLVVRGRSPGHYADSQNERVGLAGFPGLPAVSPLDMHFRRGSADMLAMASPMSPYQMTSPLTPFHASASSGINSLMSPTSPPMSAPAISQGYSPAASQTPQVGNNPHDTMSAYGHQVTLPSLTDVHNATLMHDPSAAMNTAAAVSLPDSTQWSRSRTHSVAESDSSFSDAAAAAAAYVTAAQSSEVYHSPLM
ncbi:hypothetical protein HK102_009127, partial [Quaeritorhiza haematococci]